MNTKSTLYDVAQEGADIQALLMENDGELTPELEERLDSLLKQGKDKLIAAVKVVRNIEANADNCLKEAATQSEEVERLKTRSASFTADAKRLKERILIAVDFAFGGKVKTDLFTIYGQNSPDTVAIELAPTFTLEQLKEAKPELVRTKLELEKKAIVEQHKQLKARLAELASNIPLAEGQTLCDVLHEVAKEDTELGRKAQQFLDDSECFEALIVTENPGVRTLRIK